MFTTVNTPPKAVTVASTTRVTSAAFVRSATTNRGSFFVAAVMSATACFSSASRRPQSMTRAPSRANSRAVALPRPALDAQTSTGLSVNPRFMSNRCRVDASIEPAVIEHVDQRATIKVSLQILDEEIHETVVLLRHRARRVRRDDDV